MKALKGLGVLFLFTGLFVISGYANTDNMIYIWVGLSIILVGLFDLLLGTRTIYINKCKK